MLKKGIYFIILVFFYTLSLNAIQIKVDLLNEVNSIIIQNKITASQFYNNHNNHNKYNKLSLSHYKKIIEEKTVLKTKRKINIKNNISKNDLNGHFIKKTQNIIQSNKKNKIQISLRKFQSHKSYNKNNNNIKNSYMLKNIISNLIIFRDNIFYLNKTNVMDSYNIIGLFYVFSGNTKFSLLNYYNIYSYKRLYNIDSKENKNNYIKHYVTDNSHCYCNKFLKNINNNIIFHYPIQRNFDMAAVNIHLFPQNYSLNKLSCFIKRNNKNLFLIGRYNQRIV